jgi:hypothetical protein
MHLGFFEHLWQDLAGGPAVRLVLQPTLATILGIRLGLADVREGKAPFLIRLLVRSRDRWALFRSSLSDAVIPLCLAVGLDVVLQQVTLGRIRPLAALLVGGLLVWLPFAIARALTNRIWSYRRAPARAP